MLSTRLLSINVNQPKCSKATPHSLRLLPLSSRSIFWAPATSGARVCMPRRPSHISPDHNSPSQEHTSAERPIVPVTALQSGADTYGNGGFALPGSILHAFSSHPRPPTPLGHQPAAHPNPQNDTEQSGARRSTLGPPHPQSLPLDGLHPFQGLCAPLFRHTSPMASYPPSACMTPWLRPATRDGEPVIGHQYHTTLSLVSQQQHTTSGDRILSPAPAQGMTTLGYQNLPLIHRLYPYLSLQTHVQATPLTGSNLTISPTSPASPSPTRYATLIRHRADPSHPSLAAETLFRRSLDPTDYSIHQSSTVWDGRMEDISLSPPVSTRRHPYDGIDSFLELPFDTLTSPPNVQVEDRAPALPSGRSEQQFVPNGFDQLSASTRDPAMETRSHLHAQTPNSFPSSAHPQATYLTANPPTASSPKQSTLFTDRQVFSNNFGTHQAGLAQREGIVSKLIALGKLYNTFIPNDVDPLAKLMDPSLLSDVPSLRPRSPPEQDEDDVRKCKRIKREYGSAVSNSRLGLSGESSGLNATLPKPGVGQIHSLDGCWMCRERGKKCPLQCNPQGWCLECVRLGLDCPGGYGKPRPKGSGSRQARTKNSQRSKNRRSQRAVERVVVEISMTTDSDSASAIPPSQHPTTPLDATPLSLPGPLSNVNLTPPFHSPDLNSLEPSSLSASRSPAPILTPITASRHTATGLEAPLSAPLDSSMSRFALRDIHPGESRSEVLPLTFVESSFTSDLFVPPSTPQTANMSSESSHPSFPNPPLHLHQPTTPLFSFEPSSPSLAVLPSEEDQPNRGPAPRVCDFSDLGDWFQDLSKFE
ncbi:hypothetical protein DL93DRAFT_2225840 [Clavulina sp. PMI_390]|nr:hypothetical protein DL93DRAFT_2225840 [Clavulina sp. PMI_390]